MDRSSNSSMLDFDFNASIASNILEMNNPILCSPRKNFKEQVPKQTKGSQNPIKSGTSRAISLKLQKGNGAPQSKVHYEAENQSQRSKGIFDSRKSGQSFLDMNALNMEIPEDVLMNVNPQNQEKKSENYHHSQQEQLKLPPSVLGSQFYNPQVHNPKIIKRLSLEVTWTSKQQVKDFFAYYQLKLAGVYIMHSLTSQTDKLYSLEQDKPTKAILSYLLMLKGLLMLLDIQTQRKKEKMHLAEKDNIVEDCKKFIHFMYHELMNERQKINESILKVSSDFNYQFFAKKILAHPNKTYSIFTQSEIGEIYYEILLNTYQYNNKIFKKQKTNYHLCLGLWLILCLQVDKIFYPESFSRCFAPYFAYKTEKLIPSVIPGDDIEEYILNADETTIANHHLKLRKEFNHRSSKSKNSGKK